jgi:glycerol uptake facilitator protein
MHGPVFGEFLGTAILILIGNGTVANVVLNKTKGSGSGYMTIVTGYAFAVFAGIFASLSVGGVAHLNCAVTLALVMAGVTPMSQVAGLVAGQFAGAFVGAVLVYIVYYQFWAETPDGPSKLACFSTGPAIRNLPINFVTEVIATAVLCIVGFGFGSKAVSATGLPAGYGPYCWGILIWLIGCGLGGPTGWAMNPNRDLGPRIAHAILPMPNKGDNDWSYGFTVPIFGPLVGAAIGEVICKASGIL